MGIHYDYKNTRGAKKLQKQHEKEQRRLSKKSTQTADEQEETVQENKPLTLDMITAAASCVSTPEAGYKFFPNQKRD